MNNIDYISIYFLVFSSLIILRTSVKFFGSLLSTLPKKLEIDGKELLLNGLALSHIITYILT